MAAFQRYYHGCGAGPKALIFLTFDTEVARGVAASPRTAALDGPRDQDEEFDAMQTERILQQDPDSLAFVKAAKTSRARVPVNPANSGPRSKPRAFQ